MAYLLCRHIRTNGRRCKAASLNQNIFCFFHQHLHHTHRTFRPTEATQAYLLPGQHIQLNPLEDRDSIQVALSVVINALATGQLDIKRATAILYGLQLASNNAVRLDLDPYPLDVVRTAEQTPDGQELATPAVMRWTPSKSRRQRKQARLESETPSASS